MKLSSSARHNAADEISAATREPVEVVLVSNTDAQLHQWMNEHGWVLTDDGRDWRKVQR